MGLSMKKILCLLLLLCALSRPVAASSLGACVKRPDPAAPADGDLYTMRIASGKGIAQSHGESASQPGSHYFAALRTCRPRDFVALYDSEGNAHLSFVIKDKKRSGLPLKGPNRNICDVASIIGYATDGAYEPVCPFGGAEQLAIQWTKSQAGPEPAPETPYKE